MNYKTFDEDYKQFVEEIKHHSRSFLSNASHEFLAWLEAIAQKHVITLSSDKNLFRARKSKVKGSLLAEDQMKPIKNLGSSGRANALNIPVLYLADHPEIAIAEIRPEAGVEWLHYFVQGLVKLTRGRRTQQWHKENTIKHSKTKRLRQWLSMDAALPKQRAI